MWAVTLSDAGQDQRSYKIKLEGGMSGGGIAWGHIEMSTGEMFGGISSWQTVQCENV